MKVIKYILATFLVATVGALTGCSDDDPQLAKACLASVSTLQFGADDSSEKIITVYSDGDWVVDAPDWLTVSPMSGNGTTEMYITAESNYRDGAIDNPRKANLLIKGRNLASIATIVVTQDGDKYRDVQTYTVDQLDGLADEAVVSVPSAVVVAVTSNGFIVSNDGMTSNVYIKGDAATSAGVQVGDNVAVMGTKYVEYTYFTYVESDKVTINTTGGTVTYPTPVDITDIVDKINLQSRTYVTVQGKLNGTSLTIDDASNTVVLTDLASSFDATSLSGHIVKVNGYYAGTSAPAVRVNVASIEDLGVAEIIYYSEDFEWMAPWAEVGNGSPAGRTVENDDLSAVAPQIGTPKVDGVTLRQELLNRGFSFQRVTPSGTTTSECIYVQTNYLKFGKTGYQACIVLPSIEGVPSDAKNLSLSFNWCPMRQGSGTVDPVTLIVAVINGTDTIQFNDASLTHSWESGHKLEWLEGKVELSDVVINSETQIAITQSQWGVSTANRWFLDNIKLSQPK